MINYIEKGIELHEEIALRGYKLQELNGVWTADDEEAVQEIIDKFVPSEPELPANWDKFNLAMMSNSRFNQVYNQCLSVAPLLANALPTALDQVTTKGNSLFNLVFNQICMMGGATPEDRQAWGLIADANNLPTEFISILVG